VSEETHTVNVVFNVKQINESIQSTQRMLYFTNALRLSIVDIQQVMAGPTISNVMWTVIQLTRVWTNLYRMIKKTNDAQAASILGGRLGGGGSKRALGLMGTNQAMNALFDPTWTPQKTLMQTILGYAMTTAFTVGGAAIPLFLPVGLALLVGGAVVMDLQEKKSINEREKRRREVLKSQGVEW